MHQEIADNIAKHGHHIYSVLGGENPRFCYTIGLTDLIGGELVLAGMCHVPTSRVATFINQVASRLVAGMSIADFRETLDGVGEFRLREANQSWVSEMLLGALDWYDGKSLTAWQLVVEEEKRSIDIPEMWTPFEPSKSPAWSWLKDPWPFACSSSTHGVGDVFRSRS